MQRTLHETSGGNKAPKQYRAHALVVDDNPVDAKYLETLLKKFGCFVDITDDAGYAEKLLNRYDILFVDIHMPSMSGYQLARVVRQSNQPNKEAPMIAVSSGSYTKEQVEQCLNSGMDGYIEKAVSVEILTRILAEFLPDKEVTLENISQDGSIRLKGFYRKRKSGQ